MNKTPPWAALVLAVLLAGCATATQPTRIQAAYVSPLQYKDDDCQQLKQEMQRVSDRANELCLAMYKKQADNGAKLLIGAATVPVTWFMMRGNGPEENEFSHLEGEFKTLKEVCAQKGCDTANLPLSPHEIVVKFEKDHNMNQNSSAVTNSVSRGH